MGIATLVWPKYYFRLNPLSTKDLSLKYGQKAIDLLQYCLKYMVLIDFHLYSDHFVFEIKFEKKSKLLRHWLW
jgi:hypothetical protein